MLIKKKFQPVSEGKQDQVAAEPPPQTTTKAKQSCDTVRISVRLPKAAHRRLRLESVRKGLPIASLLSYWVERHTSES